MVECHIPGHITGLYIFAVVNLCALLNISLVSADVFVIDVDKNSTIDTIQDKQAMFGSDFPEEGLVGRLIYVIPHDACKSVEPPPSEVGLSWIALISRGPCHFDQKVWYAQKAGFSAAIVHNYEGHNAIIPMGGDSSYADQVKIPSVFVGYTDGMALAKRFNYTRSSVVIKIMESSDEPPASFFLPFVVVVSICFLGVMAFSIIKCIKYFQHIRRTRLSKSALKKIPTRKYKKGDHYDTCAICLEDYEEGEKLRVLPCNHTYHCKCIDPWLTKRKKTCPQCKRRVIPGQESDSDSDGEEEGGASESTPLLGNNNNRRPAPSSSSARRPRQASNEASGESSGSGGGLPHPRTSTFEQSGLEAAVFQPEVLIICADDTDDTAVEGAYDSEEEGEELEGAVGGIGICDPQDSKRDITNVIIEVEPALRRASSPEVAEMVCEVEVEEQTPADPTPDDRLSPVPDHGSINAAFASGSSEEDGSGSGSGSGGGSSSGASTGHGGKKKKSRRGNQVV